MFATFSALGGIAVIAGMSSAAAVVARPVRSTGGDWVDPKDFGAVADGLSHPLSTHYKTLADARTVYPFVGTLEQERDWCAIQAAINTGSPVKLSAGRFRVNETLHLRSRSEIYGEGPDSHLIWSGRKRDDIFSMFHAEGVNGIRLRNFAVLDHSGSSGGYVFAGNNVVDVSVGKVVAKGMAIASFRPSVEAADLYDRVVMDAADTRFNGSADLHVTECVATDIASSADPRAAVLFRYCAGWSVTNCKFSNTPFGVQWWGGDSDPARDGVLANARKCMRGVVTNVEVSRCIAGMWGSMGRDITVSRCEVDTASDVGIDFEGCENCLASQNRVKNCTNGNFTIFWFNVGISFVENTSQQSRSDYPHLRVYNASQGIQNRSLLVKSNKFSTEGTVGVIDTASGCVEKLEFIGNELANTRVDFVANNLRYVNVINNTLAFSSAGTGPLYGIQIGELHDGGRGVIRGNIISSKVTQPKESSAIYVWSDDYNNDARFQVVGNRTAGFPIDLVTDNKSANPGTTSYFMIEGNTFGAGVYRKDDHGSKTSNCFLRANPGIPNSSGKPDWTAVM